MFVFEKDSDSNYIIKNNHNIKGRLIKDEDDGYFYYWPEEKKIKCWDALAMKTIARKLDELNKEWDREVNSYFNSQLKIIAIR